MRDREQAIEAAAAVLFEHEGSEDNANVVADAILALPVVITDEMVERAMRAYDEELPLDEEPPDEDAIMRDSMRAALEAALNPQQ